MKRTTLALILLMAAISAASGQAERYELGRHLRAFEQTWQVHPDPEARQRALVFLKQVDTSFFAGRPEVAGKYLDLARLALQSKTPPSQEVLWAESLALYLDTRLVDTNTRKIGFQMSPFYEAGTRPSKAKLVLSVASADAKATPVTTTLQIDQLPLRGRLQLGEAELVVGEYRVNVAILSGGKTLARSDQYLSAVRGLEDRLTALNRTVHEWPAKTNDTDEESVRQLVQILDDLAAKQTLETDYPAARVIAQAEEAAAAIGAGKTYYGPNRSGQFWLVLAGEKLHTPVRVFVPEQAKKKNPLPLVVAVHGLGGTENLFFDAYGRGITVKMCQKRGWLLVAPRSGFQALKVDEIVQEMARIYPVDTHQVMLIGHSMGGVQVVDAACASPRKFAGVAVLAAGGTVVPSEGLKSLPFFIGSGKDDFALGGAKRLCRLLKEAGVKKVEFREYDVEHYVVVQLAMPDVFAFLDCVVGH